MLVLGPQVEALSNAAATGLIIAVGAGGSFLFVVALTVFTVRRSERKEAGARQSRLATVGGGKDRDTHPAQPYSSDEPRSHRPYSKAYIPYQDNGHGRTNGTRPDGSPGTGIPTKSWPPQEDD